MNTEWKEHKGSKIQAALSVLGDYVISHRPNNYNVSFRPPNQHKHIGSYPTLAKAKEVVEQLFKTNE